MHNDRCQKCGCPSQGDPSEHSRTALSSSDRAGVWYCGFIVGALLLLALVGTYDCRNDLRRNAQQYQDCIQRGYDPAVCAGKVQTVRCLPAQTKAGAP